MAKVAADLHTKLIMPVPICGCKYCSLFEMSVIIMYKNTHVSLIGPRNCILHQYPLISQSAIGQGTLGF